MRPRAIGVDVLPDDLYVSADGRYLYASGASPSTGEERTDVYDAASGAPVGTVSPAEAAVAPAPDGAVSTTRSVECAVGG